MVYDKDLAERVARLLPRNGSISERRMFGSLAYMYQNNMVCGIREDGLMARVGPDYYNEALENDFTSEMNLTGRTMKNIVLVSIDGLDENETLKFWIDKCMNFVITLPPKIKTEKPKKTKKTKTKTKKTVL